MRSRGSWLKSPCLWVPLLTLVWLSFRPESWCIDCEGSNPWGSSFVPSQFESVACECWIVGWNFLAGAFVWRGVFLMPVGLMLAELATQHLGGVTWQSLRDNEGPAIVAVDLFLGSLALAMGVAVGAIYRWKRA